MISDIDIPELVSDEEDTKATDSEISRRSYQTGNDIILTQDQRSGRVDGRDSDQAFATLLRLKEQHANQTIPRPDDWLVYDPVQEKLVLLKEKHQSSLHNNANFVSGDTTSDRIGQSTPLRQRVHLSD